MATSMGLNVLVLAAVLSVCLAELRPEDEYFRTLGKRAPAGSPQWEDLGWAWGKRSSGLSQLRAYKQIKKNPDWHDLGWTWGRK